MNFLTMLAQAERSNQSLVCIGLDPDPAKFPMHWRGDASKILIFAPPSSMPQQTRQLHLSRKSPTLPPMALKANWSA